MHDRLKVAFAEAASLLEAGDRDGHLEAAYSARSILLEMVKAVRSEPGNESLPFRPVYHYIVNIAFDELTQPISTVEDRRQVELTVYLPPGRPPGRRSHARQCVIDDIRQSPGLADSQIVDRAIRYGAWRYGVSDDPGDRQRRIKRLRDDASK